MRAACLLFTSLVLGALAPSCMLMPAGNLEGDWDGEVKCGSTELDMELVVEEEDDLEYYGEALVESVSLEGVPTDIIMRMAIDQVSRRGGQVIEADAECKAVPSEGDDYDVDCSDFEELGWDGKDLIEAEIEGFLGTDFDCKMTLER